MTVKPTDIEAAYERIRPRIRQTPILRLEAGALGVDLPVALKLELYQHTGSFKPRGAFNSLLSQEIPAAGVVAASGGNHGAAVAYAASALGIPATCFVPEYASATKTARIRGYGGAVVQAGSVFSETLAAAGKCVSETGAAFIHPYDQFGTISGQGTTGLELEMQEPELDTLLVSVGGGGLAAGLTAWFEGRVRVVAVESEGTATYATALSRGPESHIASKGIAASALGAASIGAMPWQILTARDVPALLVSDEQITDAQRRLWSAARIIAEPGGITALAALTSGVYEPAAGERVGILVCGGNAEPDWFA